MDALGLADPIKDILVRELVGSPVVAEVGDATVGDAVDRLGQERQQDCIHEVDDRRTVMQVVRGQDAVHLRDDVRLARMMLLQEGDQPVLLRLVEV